MLVAVGLAAVGLAQDTKTPADVGAGQATTDNGQRLELARKLYQSHCADCHGDDGSATDLRDDFPSIPDFQSLSWQNSRSLGNLRASIKLGMGDEMPAFEGQFSADEMKSLAELVRTFSQEFQAQVAKSKDVAIPATSSTVFARELQELEARWQRHCDEFETARAAVR